jgi:hypothetical protein
MDGHSERQWLKLVGEGGVLDIEGDGTPDLFPPIFVDKSSLLTYATTLLSTI